MAGSDKLNHCCMKWVRCMVSSANGGRPSLPFGVVRCNEGDQLGPGNHLLHLLKELALAGFPAVQFKVQSGLFHAMHFIATRRFLHGNLEGYAEFPKRCVILEFPDMATFKGWWDSPEYQALRAIRERTTKSHLVVTEGV